MTGEPTHTASKESIPPEIHVLFLTEHAPQLLIIDLKVKWPLCLISF